MFGFVWVLGGVFLVFWGFFFFFLDKQKKPGRIKNQNLGCVGISQGEVA